MNFTGIKNTGNYFPLCLSSALDSNLEGETGIGEEIIKEYVLSLWAHLHRAGPWHMFEESLKCPSAAVSICSAKDSMWAVFECDTYSWAQGWEPKHP